MSTPRPIAFDARPLTDPVDPAAIRAFTQRLQAEGRLPRSLMSGTVAAIIIAVVAVTVVGGAVVTAIGGIIAALVSGGFVLGALLPLLVVGGLFAVVIVAFVQSSRGRGEHQYRLDAFARTNGMTYEPVIPAPHLPGMVFGVGSDRLATDLVRGAQPRFVEFGNYRYTTGSGKNRTTHRWGYVAVKLDAPLPHIVLDALGNNGLFGSNLPAAFDRDQRLSLEGDFDRYFSLYCPSGYETDALYLFTPDIMARFIDNAAALDVEIVDDWLFLYARRELSTLDPAVWAWMFSVVAALLDKLAQWGRWRDDRLAAPVIPAVPAASTPAASTVPATDAVASGIPHAAPAANPVLTPPPMGVAPQGRRLRRGIPWAAVIILGGIALFVLLSNLGVFGAFLSAFLGR